MEPNPPPQPDRKIPQMAILIPAIVFLCGGLFVPVNVPSKHPPGIKMSVATYAAYHATGKSHSFVIKFMGCESCHG